MEEIGFELKRVLKPGGYCIFVLGDLHLSKKIINTVENIDKISGIKELAENKEKINKSKTNLKKVKKTKTLKKKTKHLRTLWVRRKKS